MHRFEFSYLPAATAALVVCALAVLVPPHAAGQSFALPADGAPAPMPTVVTPSYYGSTARAQREGNGHFYFDTEVNGVGLRMLFDTGASAIALRSEDAGRVGVDVGGLHYTRTVQTANGTADVAPVMLASLTVGGITRHNVVALVGRPGSLTSNLLGQTFLARLAGYRLEGNELVLQGDK